MATAPPNPSGKPPAGGRFAGFETKEPPVKYPSISKGQNYHNTTDDMTLAKQREMQGMTERLMQPGKK